MINTNVSYKNVMLDNTQTLHMQLENVPFCLKGRFFFIIHEMLSGLIFYNRLKPKLLVFEN